MNRIVRSMRKELYVITWVVSIMCLGIVMVSCGGQEPVPPVKPVSFTGKRVLWLGTSIPEGCSYPKAACEKLGMHCVNQALGSSFLAIRTATAPSRYDLLSLTMSEEETTIFICSSDMVLISPDRHILPKNVFESE